MSVELAMSKLAKLSALSKSRDGWIEAARIYAKLWPSKLTRLRVKECIEKARVANREAIRAKREWKALKVYVNAVFP